MSVVPLRPGDPRLIGPFQLCGYVGKGGFGTVYVGFQPGSAQAVAVKLITVPDSTDPQWRQRMRHEVEAIRRVRDRFTAAYVDDDVDADPPWLATCYLYAPSLERFVTENGCLSELQGWWLMSSAAEALLHIHSEGLLHRDLKPGNLIMAREGVKVIDFGLAKSVGGRSITTHRQWAGTAYFAPPEQAVDMRTVTAKSDVYSLAATAVYALAGHAPYSEATASFWLQGIMPNLDGVPESMYELLESCLAGDPEARPTVSEVLDASLDHLLDYGVALFLDTPPPLGEVLLDAIDEHAVAEAAEVAVAGSAGPPPIALEPLTEPSLDGSEGVYAVPDQFDQSFEEWVSASPNASEIVGASGKSSDSNSGPGSAGAASPPDPGQPGGGPLGGAWADQWNDVIDERHDRYDG